MKRRFFSFSMSFVLVMMALVSTLANLPPERQLSGEAPVRHKATAPSATAAADRPIYKIEATYDHHKDEVTGHMSVSLPKTRSEPQTEVYFHLYPNAFHKWKYGKESKPSRPGYIQVSHVKVNGTPVKAKIRDTIMKVRLPEPLPIGKSAKIEMDYRLRLPYGGTRLNVYKNTAFLAQWYPILAVKDQEGWHLEPYTTTGDPFYTQMSDFEVTFRVPQGYRIISTGYDRAKDYRSPVTIKQENVRDFVAVLTRDYKVLKGKAGDTEVNLWYLKGMEGVSQILRDAAVSGMNFYSEKFGKYPYKEVDVVLGETGYGIAGMEYPGLVTSIPRVPTRKGHSPAINVVVHELAHQWWYGVVGNNQVKEPWLDEGLTTFSEFLYMQEKMKEDEKDLLNRATVRTNEIHKAVGVTSADSLYDYPDSVYGLMVYIRPAAMMFNLMDEIGKDKVIRILHTYYDKFQYRTATTRDFIRVANEVAGKDLTPFFQEWLYFKEKNKKG
ncbi:M1 family metallopeptidase [Paenactinomyces guangxiensis]|uniref:M1 family metallopeptidase n=1 Tax=Paenactinomyces guangxiensis TaxID=1490290 RepID=A0A7W1WNK9_9BACL|nr:M1 family metallopeptidase [Paenactinomyces guangxiensis]MBA4493177.1 M1 family metallopeptidase [Paenactinomyces guangxiensis]MBH8589973.1 M1 family metallopeptidase [Paenactinomyces guangxiensis]